MTKMNKRKITDEDIELGYSNIDVEKTQNEITEILFLDAYADEREDFVNSITLSIIMILIGSLSRRSLGREGVIVVTDGSVGVGGRL